MITEYAAELEVVPLSDHEWRVCDREVDTRDARRLIAYIEKRDADYEVMWITSPHMCARFLSLDAALTRVCRSRHESGPAAMRQDLSSS